MIRPLRAGCAAAVAVALAVFAPASPAAAHEGGGTIAVEDADPATDTSVRYVVRLTWNNDGHPAAADATTITAVPAGGDGVALTPVTLEPVDDDGRFAATVEFPDPGAWTVRFTAISPEATLEVPQQIEPPATPTSAPTTTTSSEAPTTTLADSGTLDEGDDDGGDNGPSAAGSAVFVVVLLALAAAAFVLGRRMRRRSRDQAEQAEAPDGPTA